MKKVIVEKINDKFYFHFEGEEIKHELSQIHPFQKEGYADDLLKQPEQMQIDAVRCMVVNHLCWLASSEMTMFKLIIPKGVRVNKSDCEAYSFEYHSLKQKMYEDYPSKEQGMIIYRFFD